MAYEPPAEDPRDTEFGACIICNETFTIYDHRHFAMVGEAICSDCVTMQEDHKVAIIGGDGDERD